MSSQLDTTISALKIASTLDHDLFFNNSEIVAGPKSLAVAHAKHKEGYDRALKFSEIARTVMTVLERYHPASYEECALNTQGVLNSLRAVERLFPADPERDAYLVEI